MKYSLLFKALFLIVSFGTSFSQENSSGDIISGIIQKNAQKFIKNKNINSVSIGIYKDGQVYTEHFGEIIKGKNNPPNDNTVYEVGSVSKTITGYLVAKAVLEQKIQLEDDIRIYLEGDYLNLEYNSTPISIRNLITHTSGLPMFLPFKMNGLYEKLTEEVPNEYLALEKSYSKEKFLADLASVSITAKPGTNYLYSNAGTELIGKILETIYHKSIDELLKENFSTKFNTPTAQIKLDSIQNKKLVRGYWMNSQTTAPNNLNPLWGTAGGIKMTIIDMMEYVELQLNNKNPIISESHKALYEVRSPLNIAYFWRVWKDKYGTSYNHHGGTSGTQNWLFIYPKYNLGISIITNQSGPKTPNLLSKTAQKILKELIKE
ncbi:serine hydrolase domain-containing protein [Croceitalea vernalis]|uniref:Beta-lactamase n=1 Tax=Croceitalea vernalis TaxID=3075599 RepID=A0ABU3BIN6_9FLAO|nr:serine hydrolase domain-containing protein [Croceitalea sp. P007]MDT0622032.1 serine hydrolase domain-containing protein [Croceitalea sp. P007]